MFSTGPTAGDVITIERLGDTLVLKSPSAPLQGLRLHAESERSFFLTEADIQIRFEMDSQGHVANIVFHYLGADTPAPRVDDVKGNP